MTIDAIGPDTVKHYKTVPNATAKSDDARTEQLRLLSQELESTFLAEMLKTTGINKTSDSFGGGAGEDAFSSMLTQQYATKMAENGGIGLAEHIFRSLTAKG